MLWIPITIFGVTFQVARNAMQRSLLPTAGPWGATLVRFLFGLPFSLVFLAVATVLTPGAHPHFTPRFWIAELIGAGAQVGATAALLVAMRRSSFALGTAFQQASLPTAAVLGIALGDKLHPMAFLGVGLASAGLMILSWPRGEAGRASLSGAAFGLLSGVTFGVALNAFRQVGLVLEPAHPVFAGIAAMTLVQFMQAGVLTTILAVVDRRALITALRAWRSSLTAGGCGSAASAFWFIALAMAPAALVRAVGVLEMPLAAFAGHRVFRERLTYLQMAAGLVTAGGVVLAALG